MASNEAARPEDKSSHFPPEQVTLPTFGTSYSLEGRTGYGNGPVIVVRNLSKTYRTGRLIDVPALQDVSLKIYPGEFVAVMGPSGSGKSTFMNLLGCLDRPSSGEYWLGGRLVSSLSSDQLAAVRNRMIGFVFQGFNLLARVSTLENIEQPMIYAGLPKRERERRARQVLGIVGLGRYERNMPTELSGGEQQRVAIARALVNGPVVLLADEPTGNLDTRTSLELMAVLQTLNDQGVTIVLVTHNPEIAKFSRRCVHFLDGRLVGDEPIPDRRLAQEELTAAEV